MSDNWNSWPWETDTQGREPQIPVESNDASLASEREGLPRNFRMRADRHYIDQLTAASAGQPVRMFAIDRIKGDATDDDVRPLIDSIRRHGIVHPLLVRRGDTGYSLLTGRKRLAAARMAGLATVPCLVHETADTDAAELASADNLVVPARADEPERRDIAAALRVVERHLSKVRRYADILSDGSVGFDRSAFDLLQAHTWRAALVADGLSLIARAPFPGHRERTIRNIIDELVDRFACECRGTGVTIRPEVPDELSSSGLNDRERSQASAVR